VVQASSLKARGKEKRRKLVLAFASDAARVLEEAFATVLVSLRAAWLGKPQCALRRSGS